MTWPTQQGDRVQKHLNICRDFGNRAGEGRSLGNVGNSFYSLSEHNKAIEFFTKSLNIFRELGDRAGECLAFGNMEVAKNAENASVSD